MPQYNLYLSASLWGAIEKYGREHGTVMRDSIKDLLKVGLKYFDAKFNEEEKVPRPKGLLVICDKILEGLKDGRKHDPAFLLKVCDLPDKNESYVILNQALLQLENEGLVFSPSSGYYGLVS